MTRTHRTSLPPGLWTGQLQHLIGLSVLLLVTYFAWAGIGQPQPELFWLAVATPVIHQLYVWLAWRLQLRSGVTARVIGFSGYVALFFVLFSARFLTLGLLAWEDRGSLPVSMVVAGTLSVLCFLPGFYAMYSVKRYFGMRRASGADHFDPVYRSLPLVREGIFRYTDNGMYLYAFMLFWGIALSCASSAALLVAAFSHAYIWLHFYVTEKPDMDYLYGGES